MPSNSGGGGVTLFEARHPDVFLHSVIYDSVNNPTGNVIPVVGSLVVDVPPTGNNVIWVVDAVDPTTHNSTLEPATMFVSNTDPDQAMNSLISYGNDIFRLYYDDRTSPVVVRPDSRIVVFGTDNVSYQIVTNPGPNQVVVSRNYDNSGNFTGVQAPLVPVVSTSNQAAWNGAKFLTQCYLMGTPQANVEYQIQVFNAQGAQTVAINVFTQPSVLINEAITPDAVITEMSIISTQSRSNGEIYIFQKQAISSLGLQVQLTYSDGHTRIVPIDGVQCFLYGATDFVSSYPGLQQTLVAKYYLGPSDGISQQLAALNTIQVCAETSLVVISNQLQPGVKISVIPVWDAINVRYNLNFYLYTTARTSVVNVTQWVTIDPSTPYNGQSFGAAQNLILQLDMSLALPQSYTSSTIYQQTCIIKLQPTAALERYVLKDSTNATVAYGADAPNNRRPVIHYDSAISQYYIPSIFAQVAGFLQSFYSDAAPLYDTTTETMAPTPTHFYIRDISSGQMLVSAPIPIAQYNVAFSIIGTGMANRYAGGKSNVLLEFVLIAQNNTMILYGVPVDVLPGFTYSA